MDLERSTRRSTRAVGLAPMTQSNVQLLPIDSSAKGRAVRTRALVPVEQQAAEKENLTDGEALRSQATPSESKKRRDVTKASKAPRATRARQNSIGLTPSSQLTHHTAEAAPEQENASTAFDTLETSLCDDLAFSPIRMGDAVLTSTPTARVADASLGFTVKLDAELDVALNDSLASQATMDSLADEQCTFAPGEVVWAKVKGFPWWPAQTTQWEAGKKAYRVKFFATDQEGLCRPKELRPYACLEADAFSAKVKTHVFQRALQSASAAAHGGNPSSMRADPPREAALALGRSSPKKSRRPTKAEKQQKQEEWERQRIAEELRMNKMFEEVEKHKLKIEYV